jgi:methyl-accepting chemotaxis protein PixJ
MQADRVVVYRFDEKWHGEIAYESVKPGWLKIIEMETDVPCFPAEYVEPYRKGRIQVTEDIAIAELSPCHKEQLQKWQVKANVVVPILVEQKLYGINVLVSANGPHRKWKSLNKWRCKLVMP